jgi:hypothetical protein
MSVCHEKEVDGVDVDDDDDGQGQEKDNRLLVDGGWWIGGLVDWIGNDENDEICLFVTYRNTIRVFGTNTTCFGLSFLY